MCGWPVLWTSLAAKNQGTRPRGRERYGEVRRAGQKQKHNNRRSSGGTRCDHLPLYIRSITRNLRKHMLFQRGRLSWRPRNRIVVWTAAPITSGRRLSPRGPPWGHECFLAIKPNQPENDGEYGVPDVALPNVALPIARGQRGCLTENPQYAHPLVSSVSMILPNFLCELQS